VACHRYIELNPVRAGMVGRPAQYPWSSHGHYGSARPNGLITEHPEYQRLGWDDDARRAAFRSLCADPLPERVVELIRAAINTDSALGSEKFMQVAEEQLGRSVRVPTRGRPAKIVTGKLL
jgi:putative transposase